MRRKATLLCLLALTVASVWSAPTVDGKVSQGEYTHSLSLIYDTATVSYQVGAGGGLFLAVSAPTAGWVGVGLGSVVMDGAHIFMGYVKDGTPVISEQVGQGHSHEPSTSPWADVSAVTETAGITTLEIHVPAGKVPKEGTRLAIIVAYSGSADLTTFHEDNHDGAYIDLSPSP